MSNGWNKSMSNDFGISRKAILLYGDIFSLMDILENDQDLSIDELRGALLNIAKRTVHLEKRISATEKQKPAEAG